MYVYRTPQFNAKAERYGIQNRIDDLCGELQTQRIDEVQARFDRIYPYLKRRILNQRLVARIVKVDDDPLLCLLDIFKRGDSDYEQFLEAPRDYGSTHLEPRLDEEHLRDWLAQIKPQQPATPQLPELPPNLHPWLESPGWEMDTGAGDWVIYESEEWVDRFKQPEIQEEWQTYYQILVGIREQRIEPEEFPDLPNVKLGELRDNYVLYGELETQDTAVGGLLFLLAPFRHRPSRQEIAQVGLATALFARARQEPEWSATNFLARESELHSETVTYNLLARQLRLSDLTPYARRSYPAYLLADEDSWFAIERGQEANLALSAEEEKILQSVSTVAPGGDSLPLFINGRAGSGKSTMLLYLFADYCWRKYYDRQGHRREEPLPGKPLFLTYNERLLEVARDGVKTLLSSHHRFIAERSQGDGMPSIDGFFVPFQQFLLSLLPPQERPRFDPEKYISFHRFKQLYLGKSPSDTSTELSDRSLSKVVLQLPQRSRYSPEISWHVIRSFIKGYSGAGDMTPEDYEKEVPRKERSIEVEKFQGIYHTIWEHWYKGITQEQGYWDDQDLIAKVLELNCDRPDYTAIFCDEAQDFTRRELQLILRLSRFSRYHLGYQPIHSLPFAFAGDPFQTLNPTGFHWSSVRAAFDAEVITALDPTEQLKLSINFQELAYNYRSSPPIVCFTNLIQLWRHVLFEIPELRPQRAWQQGNFPEPQKFILNHNIQAETLRNYIQDTIVIVPCEEGEELAYAQADEVLSQIFPHTSESAPLKNVLSAISAKGLEFRRVILYKFGEDCNQNVWNLRGRSIDQKVKVEYFFNKLYVAASRATERLFVVDSEKGDRQLWQYASDEALLHAILRFARTGQGGRTNLLSWEDSVRTMSIGTARDIQALQEDDPQSIAREFESKGLDAENPELLRRATQFYQDIGETEQAQVCEAWALKFEMQFREAGARFEALGESEAAWQCFWQGTCWRELFAWYEQHPDRHITMRPLVAFMVAEAGDLGAILGFTAYIDQTFDSVAEARAELTLDPSVLPQWKKAIAQYAQRLETLLSTPNLQPAQWQQFGTVLQMLGGAGYTELLPLAAQCFYRAEQYEQAVQLWEESGGTQVPEYQQAQAALQGMPEGLTYLEQVGASDRIIAEWERAGKPRDRIWLRYVAPALEAMHQYPQAFVVYVWLDELAKVTECFAAASQGAPPAKLFTVLFQYFIRKHHFGAAIGAIETYLPNVRSPETQKVALKFDIVRELALSELTPDAINPEERQRYERFIKQDILTANWQSHLSMQQVGVVLEKLGIFVETLAFYEQFVDRSDPELRQFARERWLATKQKQVDYASHQGQKERVDKNRTDLLKKARRWQISYQEIPPTPPTPPKERPTPQPRQTVTPPPTRELVVQGLPPGTTVEQLEDGVMGFSVRHLSVRVMAEGKQVLITDVLSSRDVRVYWAQRQVNVGDVMVAAADSPQLAFTVLASGYSGVLICPEHQPPRLELDIQGEPNKIAIEL